MTFYMVTALGVSTEYNQHSEEQPSYGIGQGATGDGPPGCMAISDIIIKSHNQKAYISSMLEDPSKSIKVERIVDMFVDDLSLTVVTPRTRCYLLKQ
eukprot:scaffold1999_cov36-Attheya_sp.AAC.3